jgi:hypothetical protein
MKFVAYMLILLRSFLVHKKRDLETESMPNELERDVGHKSRAINLDDVGSADR